MKYIDIFEVIPQVCPFVGAQDSQGQTDQCPQMHGFPRVVTLIRQVVNLSMAVVTGRDTIGGPGSQNLIGFAFTVGPAFIRISGLQKTAPAAAAVVVGAVGVHVDEVFFADHSLDHVAQFLGNGITKGFAYQLAGILNGKLDLAFLVPIGADLEFALADPLGIVLNDAFDFEIVIDVEFFQSGPDCKEFVPSLGIEPDLAAQILHGLNLGPDDMFPVFVVG